MIRAVFDTNIVISGCLWSGAPKRALIAAYKGQVKLIISEAVIDQLNDVISRPKFADRLKVIEKTPEQVVFEHLQFTEVIEAASISPTIQADPDDDKLLACALGGKADCIVTGDLHLLDLGIFQNIRIFTANAFLDHIAQDNLR